MQRFDAARQFSPENPEQLASARVETSASGAGWSATLPLRSAPPEQHRRTGHDHDLDRMQQSTQVEKSAEQQTASLPPPTMPPLSVSVQILIAGLRIVYDSSGTVHEFSRGEFSKQIWIRGPTSFGSWFDGALKDDSQARHGHHLPGNRR